MYNPYDFYFKKAKTQGYKARSAFKLEEIQDKFHLFDKNTNKILDIGCAPGSWIQYATSIMQKSKHQNYHIVGFDIKDTLLNIPHVNTYNQDITDHDAVKAILVKENMEKVDLIQSDMAPNTIGFKDIDAMRSIELIKQSLWIYKECLKPNGRFVIKVFMGPGFDELVKDLKDTFGGKNIKIFKPQACRTESKETYIIKI